MSRHSPNCSLYWKSMLFNCVLIEFIGLLQAEGLNAIFKETFAATKGDLTSCFALIYIKTNIISMDRNN